MKITHYGLDAPAKGLYKQHVIIARDKAEDGYFPLIYLQRPKWIKDDAAWKKIVESVQLKLPKGFEVT